LSNTIIKQVNHYIFSPGVHHQGQSLHVYYGLTFNMIEKQGIFVFVFCIYNMDYKFSSVQPATFYIRNQRFETCT